jgi:hypothetical protein
MHSKPSLPTLIPWVSFMAGCAIVGVAMVRMVHNPQADPALTYVLNLLG